VASNRLASGSGMENLKKRLAVVDGDCTVESSPGQGTRVTMTVRVQTGVSPILAIGRDEVAG
jgi:signal transduction histidine kinase